MDYAETYLPGRGLAYPTRGQPFHKLRAIL